MIRRGGAIPRLNILKNGVEMDSIKVRLEKLREKMRRENIDYFLIGSSDYHASEYVGDFFKVSEYFSGCTSDNV